MPRNGSQQCSRTRQRQYSRTCSSLVGTEKTMRRGSKPSAPRRPSQNWWVDQILRTRGIPTRKLDRDFGGAESFVPNHFSHVGISMPALLDLCLHHPQFAGILDEALGARVAADDTLEPLPHRYLAPRPALGVRQR